MKSRGSEFLANLSSRPNRVPPSHHLQESVAPPPFGSKGGDTLACGGGGGWKKFRRWERHYGTLGVLRIIPERLGHCAQKYRDSIFS
jgi:hypothetical protein